jgi:hypothetical protein
VAVFVELCKEHSSSLKGREFLGSLSDCQLFKKDSAPWG